LAGANLNRARLASANLSGCDFTGATFEMTVVDRDTRFHGARGLDSAIIVSVAVEDDVLVGDDAIAWLRERSRSCG
jgi:hypothetical protein